jgi:hypothetical protein
MPAHTGATGSRASPLHQGVATMLPELATRVGVCYVGAIMILAGLMHFVA